MRPTSTADQEAPYTVAIVAMGNSHRDYLDECIRGCSARAVADETWAINAMGGLISHDRLIIMDALPYFAKASRESAALRGYGDWLHLHPGPIYTQRVYEGFPGSVAYPLEGVLNACGWAYFSNTVAYAIGLAIYLGVKRIKLYGCDFTYGADNRGFAEAGRACVEFWIGRATHRGIQVDIPPGSTLCDQAGGRVLYGYSKPPKITQQGGKFIVGAEVGDNQTIRL